MNVALKADLESANNKIAWMEGLIQQDEQNKTRALSEQRNHYMLIGGSEFRRALVEEELQQSKDVHEITSLETHFMGVQQGYGWNNNPYYPNPGTEMPYVQYNPANDPFYASAYQVQSPQGMSHL